MRNNFRWGWCIGVVAVLVPLMAQAELTVIYDSGNTQPLAPFLEVIEDIEPDLKGSGIGFNNVIGFFCGAIAPMIMSPLGEFNIFAPFYVVFGLMIVSVIISQFLVDKKY